MGEERCESHEIGGIKENLGKPTKQMAETQKTLAILVSEATQSKEKKRSDSPDYSASCRPTMKADAARKDWHKRKKKSIRWTKANLGRWRCQCATTTILMLGFSRQNAILTFTALSETEKLNVVVLNFEGEACSWYHWALNRRPFDDWNDLKLRPFICF